MFAVHTNREKYISNIIHIYKYIGHIMPHITNHIQYVTSQISHVTNQISRITCCLSHITSFTSSISSMNQILGYNSLSALKRRNQIKLLDPSTVVKPGPLTLARTQPLWSIFRVYDHKAFGLFCTWPPKSSREQTWDSRGEKNHKNSMSRMVVQFQNPITSIVRMCMRIQIYIYLHVYTCVYIYIYTCVYLYINIYMCMYIYICVYIYLHVYIYTVYTCVYKYIYI